MADEEHPPSKKQEWMRYILAYAGGGGFGIIIAYLMVRGLLQENEKSQQFFRDQFIAEMKNNAANNAKAATAMEDAAEAMEDQVRVGTDVSNALKDLTRANEQLSNEIRVYIKESELENRSDPNASENSPRPP